MKKAAAGAAGYTALISSRIDVVAAEPYLDALVARGVPLHLACPAPLAPVLAARYPHAAAIPLEPLVAGTRWARRAHNLLCILFEGEGPSRNLRLRYVRDLARRSWKVRALLAVSRRLPKLSARRLNALLGRLLAPGQRNPFPTRHVLAVSHVTSPHLLCARGIEVVTLNESWDHPAGRSAGYPSAAVIAWNRDIGRDWQELQGAAEVLVGIPVKLRYAIEARQASEGVRTAMYAVGTCATERDWYDDELVLIDDLCRATRRAGWTLVVKPRPAGPQHELPSFAERYEHVRLATPPQSLGARDYDLGADYNAARLRELRESTLVINAITTFGLDAACAGSPVLQLDLRGSRRYPALAGAQRNHHLERYLLDRQGATLRLAPEETASEVVAAFLAAPDDRPRRFRDALRAWMVPEAPAERVAAVADALVARLGAEG